MHPSPFPILCMIRHVCYSSTDLSTERILHELYGGLRELLQRFRLHKRWHLITAFGFWKHTCLSSWIEVYFVWISAHVWPCVWWSYFWKSQRNEIWWAGCNWLRWTFLQWQTPHIRPCPTNTETKSWISRWFHIIKAQISHYTTIQKLSDLIHGFLAVVVIIFVIIVFFSIHLRGRWTTETSIKSDVRFLNAIINADVWKVSVLKENVPFAVCCEVFRGISFLNDLLMMTHASVLRITQQLYVTVMLFWCIQLFSAEWCLKPFKPPHIRHQTNALTWQKHRRLASRSPAVTHHTHIKDCFGCASVL